MKRFSGLCMGAIFGAAFAGLCFGFGLIHEIAIGRRSAIPGISREVAIGLDKLDFLGLGRLGWKAAKGLHYLLTNVLGIGATNALETPLFVSAIAVVALSSFLGGIVGKIGQTLKSRPGIKAPSPFDASNPPPGA